VVQRGVGEHDAQSALARGHAFRYPVALSALQEHYGARRQEQEVFLFRGRMADASHLFQISSHKRKWFVLAHLAAPESPHRPLIERVAGEVVASEALDGDDGPSPQHPGRAQDGVIRF
jgi:hypothetical protein